MKVWQGRGMGVRLKASGALCLGTHPKSVINPLVRIAVSVCHSQGAFAHHASALMEKTKALFCSHQLGFGVGPLPRTGTTLNRGQAPASGLPASLEPGMPTQQGHRYFRAGEGKKMVHLGSQSLGGGASGTHLPGVLAPLWATVCFL